mmetsp:Transcript_5570/g.10065  ORF Transcript_5570/g.10065 Transcript_5570/m.10065 type:complete len:217 (-) Transcript_5570:59-709(-)
MCPISTRPSPTTWAMLGVWTSGMLMACSTTLRARMSCPKEHFASWPSACQLRTSRVFLGAVPIRVSTRQGPKLAKGLARVSVRWVWNPSRRVTARGGSASSSIARPTATSTRNVRRIPSLLPTWPTSNSTRHLSTTRSNSRIRTPSKASSRRTASRSATPTRTPTATTRRSARAEKWARGFDRTKPLRVSLDLAVAIARYGCPRASRGVLAEKGRP